MTANGYNLKLSTNSTSDDVFDWWITPAHRRRLVVFRCTARCLATLWDYRRKDTNEWVTTRLDVLDEETLATLLREIDTFARAN